MLATIKTAQNTGGNPETVYTGNNVMKYSFTVGNFKGYICDKNIFS